MQQRLYPAIHEGFYVYFIVFIIGLVLTINVTKPTNIAAVVDQELDDDEKVTDEYETVKKLQ
jgi:hypothetical protein